MGVSIALIKKLNGIDNDDYLYPGRKIRLMEIDDSKPPVPQPIDKDTLKIPKDPLTDNVLNRKRSQSTADELYVHDDNIKKPGITKGGSMDETDLAATSPTEGLKSKLKSTLATGGNISNIDKIFEHVLNESK